MVEPHIAILFSMLVTYMKVCDLLLHVSLFSISVLIIMYIDLGCDVVGRYLHFCLSWLVGKV